MFVGLQGSGKTTTVMKLGYHYSQQGWKTALVCADTFRAGALDQLKQNAKKARLPYYGSYTDKDPVSVATKGVKLFKEQKMEIIIVDTSGRHRQEEKLFEEMQQINKSLKPDQVIFVLDATIGQAAYNHAKAFSDSVDVGSVIITKLDGHAKGGGALSAVAATGSPITFIGSGETFRDLEKFEPRSFITRMLGMGDLQGLAEMIKESDIDQNPEDVAKFFSGDFTYRDLYKQFENMRKLGPVSQILDKLPLNLNNMPQEYRDNIELMFKKMLVIMDSMKSVELDCLVPLDTAAIERIARGSGTSVFDVNLLIKQYKTFKKMFKGKKGQGGAFQQLAKMAQNPGALNPNSMAALQNSLGSMMNPAMLSNMGGARGLSQMMGQMMNQFSSPKEAQQLAKLLGTKRGRR